MNARDIVNKLLEARCLVQRLLEEVEEADEEIIGPSALRFPDGFIVTGSTHSEALRDAYDEGLLGEFDEDDDFAWQQATEAAFDSGMVAGYLLTNGIFVDRQGRKYDPL